MKWQRVISACCRVQTAEDTASLPSSLTNDRIICLQGALFLHYPFCHGFTLLYLPLSLSLVDKINGVGGATPVPDAVSYRVILCWTGDLEVSCLKSAVEYGGNIQLIGKGFLR